MAPPSAAQATSGRAMPSPPAVPPVTARRPPTMARPVTWKDTPVRALPKTDRPAFSPAFSSNGTAIFFQTGGARDASSAIAVAPADDLRIIKVIDDGARNYHAQPSPDGRFIAFDSDREGERAVYVANRDGRDVRRISGSGYAALPTWSPDGARLAYVRAEAGSPRVWNLWIQPLDGSSPRRLTDYRAGQTWNASWFPDGRRIAYSHEDTLTILDLSSGQTHRFASPVSGRLVRTPAVSPDGSMIVFQVIGAGAWLLDVGAGTMQCVLADPTAEEFAWAPDGHRIAFHSRRDGQWSVYLLPRG
jgi:TolB protein